MDGNRRWARTHHLPLIAGHTKGYQMIEPLIDFAHKKEIQYLTFWAFSTENWNRDKKEVEILLQIFRKLFAGDLVKRLQKNGVKVCVLGDFQAFPNDIVKSIKGLIETTKDNKAITVNIGLNYGGRPEIIRAVNQIIKDSVKQVDEQLLSTYLYTKDQPDPDLIIRTSGEQRLSGFLPWQSVYSELYFPEIYWPDFTTKEFEKALIEFEKRKRRFGS